PNPTICNGWQGPFLGPPRRQHVVDVLVSNQMPVRRRPRGSANLQDAFEVIWTREAGDCHVGDIATMAHGISRLSPQQLTATGSP
ncbi:MAG: hypothetical protein ABIU87_05395, partial [Ornithinibacter sp.]